MGGNDVGPAFDGCLEVKANCLWKEMATEVAKGMNSKTYHKYLFFMIDNNFFLINHGGKFIDYGRYKLTLSESYIDLVCMGTVY